MFDKKIYILIALLVLLRFASGEIKVKGSIAFVIDDTDSMSDEIDQVQNKTKDIFDAVFKSDASQIDEFIIVTFNDPGHEGYSQLAGANFQINTDDPGKFNRTLSYIVPSGGGDCPEMAMEGIELALDKSKPNSFLYAFTDASAKDYMEYENVKSLALEKSIQINFLLTGKCDDTIEEQDTVYDRLAAATSGQVLHIGKLDISQIIKYILTNLSNKRTILLHKTNGCDHLKFTVDSKVWDIYIALSAPRPIRTNKNNKFTVFGPDGNRASTLDFINSENTTIVQLKGNPGEYSIDIRDCEKITVVVSAATSVSFQHGFSPVRPSSIDETSTKPVNGIKSYLAIALDNDNRDVTLKTVEIRDMDDKLVQQLPFKLVDEEEQFYITDLFIPPEKSFKVAINGYTKLNEKITRVSQTSIEYHRPEIAINIDNDPLTFPYGFLEPEDKERSATITVIGPKEVLAEYNEPLMLKCKVTGFPKPETRWLDKFYYVMEAEEQKISPYEYISVLHIDKVTMNETYTCKAVNYVPEFYKNVARDYVSVIVGKRSFFHVLEYPTDVTVEFGKPVELNFKINAKPSATITWYQDNKIITNSEDITISSDGSSFNIKSAKPSLEGEYYVTASNGYVEKKYQFIITVTIKEKPAAVTILGLNKIIAEYDQPLSVKCKVEGFPKPNIIWEDEFHRRFPSKIDEITPYEYLNTLYIDKVTENVTYICKANNILNEDSGSIQVITKKKTFFNILEYPKDVAVEYNKSVELNLKIDAMPPATIIWFQVDKEIRNNHDFHISADGSLLKIKNAQPGLEGKYYVKATNGDEKVKYEFDVTVIGTEVPRIDKHVNSYTTLGKSSVNISCRVMRGKPEPTISWSFDYNSLGKFINLKETTETIHIENVTANDIGTYRCNVSNVVGSDHHEMQLYIEGSIKIETPKQTTFYVKLESALILPCHVTGYPEPTVKWFQYPTGPETAVKEIESDKDNNVILQNIQYDHEGLYICRAINNIGRDEINYTVNIQEVPRIDKHVNSYTTLGKSSVDINCRVMRGKPEPTISWSFDYNSLGKFINLKETTETIHIENVTANDIGTYRCNVSNVVGSDHHEMQLDIEGSIKIETPKQTTFYVKLESVLILPCHVTGYPKQVTWFQYPTGPETPVKEIKSDKDNNVILQNIQYEHEGLYICRAINSIGRVEINYTVNVQDPTHNISLVEGDLQFSLSCFNRRILNTTVTWTINGTEVGRGEGFDILRDGNLTASNVTMRHRGTYICKAENGGYRMEYEVDVHKFPHIVNYSCPRIIPVAEGTKVHTIFCDKQVKEGDLARWFKDGKLIKTGGNFTFMNVTKADAGYYTCRYNPSEGVSCSFDNRVIVGTKPKFVTEASLTVKFKAGAQAHLDCSATGKPPPITKWYGKDYSLNKTCINAPQQWCNYTFTMHNAQNTSYMCTVSNEFDTIKRKFEIIPDECLMDLKRDFTAQQPLLVTGNRKLQCPVFNISDGSLKMHKHKKFKFFCPNSFISYNHSDFGITLETSCLGDSMFDLRGRTVKASEITCNTTIIPIEKNILNRNCLGSNTELLNIGFDVDGSPVCTAFSVCFNEKTKTPIFAKHNMHKAIANTIPVHVAGYTRGTRLSFEFEDIYDCRNQVEAISSFTGKPLKTVEDEKCCFKKRQLVNPKDVLPGISQVTTYHYLNVVPQWSTCGTENWDEVERRVRLYFALNSKVRTMIWTGATSVLKNVAPIILKDKLNQELQVPQFIWKVIENQLAIIHINVPGLTSAQASSYTLCTDICESVEWMRSTEWHNVDKGFIYCCSIPQFEQAFHYEYIFAKKIS